MLRTLMMLALAAAGAAKGTPVTIDGMTANAPADWKEVPTTSSMRVKQFSVPHAPDDKADKADKQDAELVVFFFGAGSGGDAEANITRWKTLFEPPAGKAIDQVTKVQTFKVKDVKVTYVDISGTYLFKARPMDTESEKRPGHRMIAIVWESKNGPYFMRLVGPEKTVTRAKSAFDSWLKSFK
jgi:hypothetical protein